jgi:hypothetical protein
MEANLVFIWILHTFFMRLVAMVGNEWNVTPSGSNPFCTRATT